MPNKEWAESVKSFVISVSFRTGCYRHIKIAADATLYDLHLAIIDAFVFEDDHAHAFFMDNRLWSDEDSYFCEDIEDEERYTPYYNLNEVLRPGHSFKYLFDFGDEFAFQCRLLNETDDLTKEAQIVRSKGDPPVQYMGWDIDDDEDEDDDDEDDYIIHDESLSEIDCDELLFDFEENTKKYE
ncbi:MAG: hypothetical protein PHZ09_14895 [Eubacteriales bacterium]|jgi:hypothetical protein|nr:hypothetical protein [Eubacteriales bacterium]